MTDLPVILKRHLKFFEGPFRTSVSRQGLPVIHRQGQTSLPRTGINRDRFLGAFACLTNQLDALFFIGLRRERDRCQRDPCERFRSPAIGIVSLSKTTQRHLQPAQTVWVATGASTDEAAERFHAWWRRFLCGRRQLMTDDRCDLRRQRAQFKQVVGRIGVKLLSPELRSGFG